MKEKRITELTIKELKLIIHEVVSEELSKRGYVNPPTYYQPPYYYEPYYPTYRIICTDHTITDKDSL